MSILWKFRAWPAGAFYAVCKSPLKYTSFSSIGFVFLKALLQRESIYSLALPWEKRYL
jgi:hypothetical protein